MKTYHMPLERLQSQDLKNQQGQFCKVGQNILHTRIETPQKVLKSKNLTKYLR